MAQERIPTDKATLQQLRDFAEVIMGLELAERETKQTILGKLAAAGFTGESVPAVGAAPVAATSRPASTGPGNRRMRPGTEDSAAPVWEVQILIPTSSEPGGDEPVPVGVNGRVMYIPRGEPVWVNETYVEALNNAERYVYEPYTEGMGGLSTPRVVKSYPFQYV